MKPTEAMKVATGILRKANLLVDEGLTNEWVVRIWHTGGDKVKFGFAEPRGSRKKVK